MGWIGVDLDGTLADYSKDRFVEEGPCKLDSIGPPIPAMVNRVKQWLSEGKDVRIFTARCDGYWNGKKKFTREETEAPVKEWCRLHLGRELPITAIKDYHMEVLYDDRCIQVEKNTGELNPLQAFEEYVSVGWKEIGTFERNLFIAATGLGGETGEVLEHLKKFVRDGKLDKKELALELGDLLHYWIRICQYYELKPTEIMTMNIEKLNRRRGINARG